MSKPKQYNEEAFDETFKNKALLDYSNVKGQIGHRDRKVIATLQEFGIRDKKCLDVGPGTGRWLQFLKDNNASYLGAIDISQESLNRCSGLADKLQKADVERDEFKFENDQFDIVISFMILEHLRDPENYIREIVRVTKEGGMILLTIPNLLSFMSRIRVLFGILPYAITSDKTHVKFYTGREFEQLFAPYGLKIELIPTSISLNPFNHKSLRIPSNKLISSLDDHILVKVNK